MGGAVKRAYVGVDGGRLVQTCWQFFDAYRALLEVGFAGDRIEGTEGYEIGVGLGEVEGHEDLAGSDDSGDAEFEVFDGATAGDDVDAVVGAEFEAGGVERVHFEPGVGDHGVKHLYLGGFGAGVPVFDGASGVEDEGVFFVGLLGEGQAGDGVKDGFAIGGGKDAVVVEALATPLDSALIFNLLPGEVAVVAHTSGGDALPLLEGVVGGLPAGEELFADAEFFGDAEEDVEVGAGFRGWWNEGVDLADASLGVGVGAFFFSPDGCG